MKQIHLTNLLEIEYKFIDDKGDYYNPPFTDVEIIDIKHKDGSVRDLLEEVAPDYISDLYEKLENINLCK